MIVVVLPFFFVNFDLGADYIAWGKSMDLFHVFFFGGLSWAVVHLFRNAGFRWPVCISVFFSVLLIFVIEYFQPQFGRTASNEDHWLGLIGMVVGVVFASRVYLNATRLRKTMLWLAALILGAILSKSAIDEWYAVYWRAQQFPVLGRFEQDVERLLWKPGNASIQYAAQHVGEGAYALEIETRSGYWSGIHYNAGGRDWRPYRYLKLTVFNPGKPFVLTFRIDDAHPSPEYAQRINTVLPVASGWNDLVVDLPAALARVKSGDFDMSNIYRMIIFVGKGERESRQFYVDNVRLE